MTAPTKHTPGPWEVFVSGVAVGVTPSAGHIGDIAHCAGFHVGARSLAEERANARLIAAAPELLEALRALVGDESHDLETISSVMTEGWIETARAAIAKAEGRE